MLRRKRKREGGRVLRDVHGSVLRAHSLETAFTFTFTRGPLLRPPVLANYQHKLYEHTTTIVPFLLYAWERYHD